MAESFDCKTSRIQMQSVSVLTFSILTLFVGGCDRERPSEGKATPATQDSSASLSVQPASQASGNSNIPPEMKGTEADSMKVHSTSLLVGDCEIAPEMASKEIGERNLHQISTIMSLDEYGTMIAPPSFGFVTVTLRIFSHSKMPSSVSVDIARIRGYDDSKTEYPVIAHSPYADHYFIDKEVSTSFEISGGIRVSGADATIERSGLNVAPKGLNYGSVSYKKTKDINNFQFNKVNPDAEKLELYIVFCVPNGKTLSSVALAPASSTTQNETK